jgi:hypothetical protein
MIAGRLAGAFRNNGRDAIADEIVKTMAAAGYDVRESDRSKDRCIQSKHVPLNCDAVRDAMPGPLPDEPGIAATTSGPTSTRRSSRSGAR